MKTQHTPAEIYIPDLWHIAQSQESISDKEEILDVWHKAHKMRDTLIAQSDLLEACKAALAAWEPGTSGEVVEKLEAAIAKAEGK